MNKKSLLEFLLKARTETYAGASGKVKPAFKDSEQLEYKEGDFQYRDVYYPGNGIFVGVEVVYFQGSAVFSMSYFGNYKAVSEEEIDKVLRKALLENWAETRIWKKVEWADGPFKYICDGSGGWEELVVAAKKSTDKASGYIGSTTLAASSKISRGHIQKLNRTFGFLDTYIC